MAASTRRAFLASSLLAGASACISGAPATSKKQRPNILWITCEDMSAHLGCYGDDEAHTPNIDRLAAEGRRYTRVFTVAAVCAPSRSCLITGMYPTSLGTCHMRCNNPPPDDIRCFSAYLRQAGYYCTNNVKTDYQFAVPEDAWDDNSKTAHWRNRPDRSRPFFAVFNSTRTHESQIGNLANASPQFAQVHDPEKVTLPPYYPDTKVIRQHWAHYRNLIAEMDAWVGDILNQLREDGLERDTIVFFFSDHGAGLPRAKRWMFDSGLHVPLIVRWPGEIEPGEVADQLTSFVDFAPTVLSLAGVPIPGHMQGKPFLGEAETALRTHVFAARDRMDERYDIIRAARNDRYKYIRNYEPEKGYPGYISYCESWPVMQELRRMNEAGALNAAQQRFFVARKPLEELYDTASDPHELNNLADSPEYGKVLAELRESMDRWMDEIDDLGFVPETELAHWVPASNPVYKKKPATVYTCPAQAPEIFGRPLAHWVKLLNQEDRLTRFRAIKTIGLAGGVAEPLLREAVSDEEVCVAYWAVVGLGNLTSISDDSIATLVAALPHESQTVKLGVARALCAHGHVETALPIVLEASNQDDFFVRLFAMHILESIEPKTDEILAALRAGLDESRDQRDYIADVVRHALGMPAER